MAGLWTTLASLAAAGSLMVTGALNAAAPQHDAGGNLLLVNREWRISESFVPQLRMTNVPGQLRRMRPDAAAALEAMYAACHEETGATLVDVSGYRAYSKQVVIYKRKLRSSGSQKKADEFVARPGASEHQTGLTMDIGQRNASSNLAGSFGKTKGGIWLRENSWRYGFILRYDQEWEEITGYRYEPWHFRYVGVELARQIHDANIPLETWLLGYREGLLLDIVTLE